MSWLLQRLRETSTWRGLVWLATVAGLSLRPDQAEAIVTAGMALAGLLGVFLADEPMRGNSQLPPIELQGRASAPADPDAERLRQSVPADGGPVADASSGRGAGWNDR